MTIEERTRVELTETVDTGAYFTPIPSGVADDVAQAFDEAGLLCHIEFLPRRENGYPYSLARASEILACELPDVCGRGTLACVLVSRVSPETVFELVRQLDWHDEGGLSPDGIARLHELMERSYEGEDLLHG